MTDYERLMQEDYEKSLQQNTKTNKGTWGVVCPHSFDTPHSRGTCVLCELCKEVLFDKTTPKNSPLKDKARNVNAKKRYYSNMIFVANPSELVVLEYGEKIFNKLIAGQVDKLSEWKNFMHPSKGRNLYITKLKVGSEPKDVDYYVEARMATSALQDPTVLSKLWNLNDMLALIESGKVVPVYQSKFDFAQKTEVRFLPSGDKETPFLFYKSLLWHYNVTKEDFEEIQKGRFNPITNQWIEKSVSSEVSLMPASKPVMSKPPVAQDDLLSEWDDIGGVDTYSVEEEESPSGESAVEPICYSQYDPDNTICTSKCVKSGWADSCRKLKEDRLALRSKAKKVSQR